MNNDSKRRNKKGEETSRTPLAYTERFPGRYVRTVRLDKTLYLDFLTYGGKTIKTIIQLTVEIKKLSFEGG